MCVGSGMGPATRAPVRFAVSTMSLEDLSSNWWSNALRRMRILVVAAIFVLHIALVDLRRAEDGRGRDLLQNLRDDAGADGATAFADSKALLLFECDRGDELDGHL